MVRVYFAGTDGFDASRAAAAGRGRSARSAAAWSLLLRALEREYGLRSLPDAALNPAGKPYFPSRPDICFSLSHTRGWVLCAVSGSEVGADVQAVRERDLAFAERLMGGCGRDFTLHELWCLRESFYKLTGRGSLRSMPFRREAGGITAPERGVVCRLYADIPGCAAAAAAYYPASLPERLVKIETPELQKGIVM